MKKFGLIGYPLSHSFSKKYFTEKFEQIGIANTHSYDLFEIENIKDFPQLLTQNPELLGFNVTIPHKLNIIPFLHELDSAAQEIGAVNVVKILDGKLKGYNSDYYGFKHSLQNFLGEAKPKALILGTGGASRAIVKAMQDLQIEHQYVSRKASKGVIEYAQVIDCISEYKLIVNTSPVGMYPATDSYPDIPYHLLDNSYFLYDLVYNPLKTRFMQLGVNQGSKVINGLEMLVGQAEKAWEIWSEQ